MSFKRKFKLNNYIQEKLRDVPPLMQAEEEIRIKEELKSNIENDYSFCQSLYNLYSNFNEIVDIIGAVIVNKPLKEFYSKAIEDSIIEQWKNSPNIEDQALYWQQWLRNNASDKDSQAELYWSQKEYLLRNLDTSIAMGGDQRLLNAQIDGLDKAALMLSLPLVSSQVTTDNGEQSTIPLTTVSPTEDITSEETEELLGENNSPENQEGDYLIVPTTDSDGNTHEEIYKLFHQFTRTGPEGLHTILGDALVNNWTNCTNNPEVDFQPQTPIPNPAECTVEKDLFIKLSQHITTKFTKDLKEQCKLVIDGIETKSNGEWTDEKL